MKIIKYTGEAGENNQYTGEAGMISRNGGILNRLCTAVLNVPGKDLNSSLNKAYRPNAHLLSILMHYNIDIIIMLHY